MNEIRQALAGLQNETRQALAGLEAEAQGNRIHYRSCIDQLTTGIQNCRTDFELILPRLTPLEAAMNDLNALANQMILVKQSLALLEALPERLAGVEAAREDLKALVQQLTSRIDADLNDIGQALAGLEAEAQDDRVYFRTCIDQLTTGIQNCKSDFELILPRLTPLEAAMNDLNALSNQMILVQQRLTPLENLPEIPEGVKASIAVLWNAVEVVQSKLNALHRESVDSEEVRRIVSRVEALERLG